METKLKRGRGRPCAPIPNPELPLSPRQLMRKQRTSDSAKLYRVKRFLRTSLMEDAIKRFEKANNFLLHKYIILRKKIENVQEFLKKNEIDKDVLVEMLSTEPADAIYKNYREQGELQNVWVEGTSYRAIFFP